MGDVASYWNESGGGDALLPAWSVQPPIELALALSGPLYVSVALQESMPEVASVPLQLIETGRLYQPSWSAGRAGLTATVGGVASYCRPKSSEALFPAKSVQLPWAVALAPSGPAYMSDEHEAIPEVASVPCQSSRTALLYQPFASGDAGGGRAGEGGWRRVVLDEVRVR